MLKLPSTIEKNIGHFTGRAWLLPYLLKWFEQSDERLFILTGEPGTGKSMVAAWLAGAGPLPADAQSQTQLEQLRSWVKAAHFCIAASGSVAPKAFAQNVATQLTSNVQGFGDALAATLADMVQISVRQDIDQVTEGGSVTGVYIKWFDLGGLGDELSFDRTLREPLMRLYNEGYDEPMVLLVDALDEAATYTGVIDIGRLLARLSDLPQQVRILATTRPDPRVLKYYRDVIPFDLIEDAPPDVDDTRVYAHDRLAALDDTRRSRLASQISQAAEGNFLYTHLILSDLLPRLPDVPDLLAIPLPKGLGGVYHDFLNRELGTDEDRWYDRFEPVLGLVAVAQGEGLTRTQIERITGQDARRTLRICKQYLDGDLPDGPFRPFHRSFADFLLEDEENEDYHIDAANAHRQMVAYYRGQVPTWKDLDWSRVDDYGLFHLMAHLYALKDIETYRQELYGLICQPFMREKLARTRSHHAFAEDVALVIGVASDEKVSDLVQVIRGSLIYATLGELAASVPPEVLGVLTRVGQTTKAQGYAALIQDPGQQSLAYRWIGEALLARNELEDARAVLRQALAAAETIDSDWDKASELGWVAEALAQAGEIKGLNQALEAAEAIENELNRVMALGNIARALVQVGEKNGLDRALGAAAEIRDGSAKAFALDMLAPVLAQSGELNRALEVAETIENEGNRASALSQMAEILAQVGNRVGLDRVRMAATAVEGQDAKALVLSGLVRALAQVGEFDRALAEVEAIGVEEHRASALSGVVQALAQAGEFDRALAEVEAIGIEEHAVSALSGAAQALARAGEEGRAVDVANKALAVAEAIGDDEYKAYALNEVAQAMAQARDQAGLDRVLTAAAAIKFPDFQLEALNGVAEAMAQARDEAGLGRALAAAEAIEDEDFRASALSRVATAFAQMGDDAQALAITEQVLVATEVTGGEVYKAAALGGVAEALTWMGNFDQALAAAVAIEDQAVRASTLSEMAQTLAQVEQLDRALLVVATIGDEGTQAETFGELVQMLARVGDRDGLSQIVAAVERAPVEWFKAIALPHLVLALTEVDDKAGLDQVITMATAIEDEEAKGYALGDIALVLSHVKDRAGLNRVLVVAEAITSKQFKAEALGRMTLALAQTGDLTQAAGVADRALALAGATDDDWRVAPLILVAQALAQVGDEGKATDVIDQALVATAEMDNRDDRTHALEFLTGILAQIGKLGRALEVVPEIEDEGVKASVLGQLSLVLAEAGDRVLLNQALAIAEAVRDEGARAEALVAIALAMAQIGEEVGLDQTLAAMEGVGDEDEEVKTHILSGVALAIAQLEENAWLNRVLAALEAIEDNEFVRAAGLSRAAYGMAAMGDFKRALAAAEAIKVESTRGEALSLIAQTLAEAGRTSDLYQVLASVEAIADEKSRAEALGGIASALVEAGEADGLNRVLTAAEAIEHEGVRAFALDGLAHVLAQTGDRTGIVRVLGTANAIEDEMAEIFVLSGLVQALEELGERDEAVKVANQALALAEAIETGLSRSKEADAMGMFVQDLAQMLGDEFGLFFGQFGEADVLSRLAQALAQVDRLDQALVVAEAIPDQRVRVFALTGLAQRANQMEHQELALQVLQAAFTAARLVSRESVFQVLEQGASALADIDRGQTLWRVYEAVLEVESWWAMQSSPSG
jgi:tetratricopeptide (TPR) repeat protein